jgi:hypothetical protein
MNKRLKQIYTASESRYLTRDEMKEILSYTTSIPQRFKVAGQVEAKENDLVRSVIEYVKPRYPNMERFHPRPWERGARDVRLVLRHAVQAMIADDVSGLEERLLFWLRSIFAGVDLTPQFVRDTFSALEQAVKTQLPPEVETLLGPVLARVTEVLSDFPEPAVPSV